MNSKKISRYRLLLIAVAISISGTCAFAQTTSIQNNNTASYGIDPATGLRDPWLWPFASTSPWNTPIGSGARYSSDDEQITKDLRKLKPVVSSGNWSMPFYLASATDPVRRVIGAGTGIPGDGKGNRIMGYDAQTYSINFPADAKPDPGESPSYKDGHLFIVAPDHVTVTEMYFGNRNLSPTGDVKPLGVIQNDLRGNGWGTPGERAMSSSAFAGIIRVGEIAMNNIPHVITFAVSNKYAKSGPVWPSTTEDSFGLKGRGEIVPYGGLIAMGSLIAIPPSVDVAALGLTPAGLTLAHCLQDYGAYMADTGGTEQLTLYVENSAADMPQLNDMRNDFRILAKHLTAITNNTPKTIGGGGTPRRPAAPGLMTHGNR